MKLIPSHKKIYKKCLKQNLNVSLAPKELNASQVKYVEVKTGLAATNKYGSQGAGGVILVKTNVSSDEFNSSRNLWNRSAKKSPKEKKKKKKKKKS